jgi:hypothetical protein
MAPPQTLEWKAAMPRGPEQILTETRELFLPVTGSALAEFILSLLGQKRTIEKNYPVVVLFVKYEWVLNLVEVIDQRVSQNVSSMASFQCRYFFQNGMVKTVNSIAEFRAFHDNSQEKTVGIEVFITYLVEEAYAFASGEINIL